MAKQRLSVFADKEFNRSLIRLALPIAIQSLMLAAVAAADAFMLGGVEQNAMSAVSLATQIQFIQNILLSAFVGASAILCAQYWGKRDKDSINFLFCYSLKFCFTLSALFFIGCVFFPRYLMLIFTNEEALIKIGIDYLRLAGWSYLLTAVSQNYLSLLKVSDHAAESSWISSGAVIVNILLNAVFIFGMAEIPAMGVRGAALATLIARSLELIASVMISYRPGYIPPDLRGIFRKEALLAKDFIKCFLPLLGASMLWGVGFTSYSAFMGHMGTDAAAANSIAAVIRDLVCCLCNGLASGGGILVGNELGAGRLDKGKLYGDRIAVLAFICGAASCLIMFGATPPILSFVKLTPEARDMLLGMMIIMAVYMIGRAVNTILINGIFAAGGDTLFDMYSLVVTMWMLAVPLAAAGTFWLHWSPLVVYACTCLDEVGKIPWVLVHYRKYIWVKDLTREKNA